MDYEKYYDIRADKSYVIHFPNNKGFTVEELQPMFSAYGKILSIDNRGQSHGLCFVRFADLHDVKRCIDGFKNHPHIKILVHKKKAETSNVKKTSSFIKNTFNTKKGSSNQFENKNQKRDSMPNQVSLKNVKCDDLSDSTLKPTITRSTNTFDSNIKSNHLSDGNLNSSCEINNEQNSKLMPNLKRLSILNKIHRTTSCSSFSSEDCNKSSKSKQEVNMDEIPALISGEQDYTFSTKVLKPSTNITPAQEVIVANIHHSLSVHYILHLFEKFDPIAVSLMKTTPNSEIRYCHVYYKSLDDAFATIKEFDKCLLRGKNLMVLLSQQLAEKSYAL